VGEGEGVGWGEGEKRLYVRGWQARGGYSDTAQIVSKN